MICVTQESGWETYYVIMGDVLHACQFFNGHFACFLMWVCDSVVYMYLV